MNKLLSLGFAVTAAALPACADSEESECLPGDIECNENASGGKADGWDYLNDPSRLANALQYRLSEIPKVGKIEKPIWKSRFPNAPADINVIWPESYFPSSKGSTNWRWIGP